MISIEHKRGEGICYNNLGNILFDMELYPDAEQAYINAIRLAQAECGLRSLNDIEIVFNN